MRALAILLAIAALAAGCRADDRGQEASGGGRAADPRPAIAPDDFRGARLTVGSKEFTEQLVLGQISLAALEAGGARVRDRTGIEGSETTRRALVSGAIDIYWEYTGTAQLLYLNQQPISSPKAQHRAVARADRANGIAWLEPAPANNTYAIALRREARGPLDVETISDLKRLLRRSPQDARLCVAQEFVQRDDGLEGLERAYGFVYPVRLLTVLEEDEIYAAVDQGAPCTFGEVFLTAGRNEANELYILEDDKGFFTSYHPALNVRIPVLREHPRLEPVFEAIAAELTTERLRSLNARVAVEGAPPDEVARDFLEASGFTR